LNSTSISTSRIKFIDGLRAIAVLLVVFFHFYFQQIAEGGKYDVVPSFLQAVFQFGNMGVYIFFVISGFIISYVTFDQVTNWPYIAKFILRRQIRLDPPFWLTVLFGVIIAVFSAKLLHKDVYVPDAIDLITNFTYTFDIFNRYDIIRVGWTLCLEIQFYLVYILLIYFTGKWGGSQILKNLVFYFIFLFSLVAISFYGNRSSAFIVNYWYVFFLGVSVTMNIKNRLNDRVYILFLITPLLLMLLLPSLNIVPVLFSTMTSFSIFFVFKLKKQDQWLSSNWVQFFGTISYSLYLTHCLVGNKLIRFLKNALHWAPDNFGSTFLILFASFAISCIFAWIFYRLVERTSLHWSKKLTT